MARKLTTKAYGPKVSARRGITNSIKADGKSRTHSSMSSPVSVLGRKPKPKKKVK